MDTDHLEGSDTVVSKGECPKCGSSRGFVRYLDGHAHCYGAGCDHWEPATGSTERPPKKESTFGMDTGELLTPDPKAGYNTFEKRKLSPDTLRRYGVFQAPYSKQVVHVYPYFDFEGNPAVQKLRFPSKEFSALKAPNAPGLAQCRLFGHQVYGDRFDRQLIITEGELDALSVAQVLDFKTAVVSIGTGAGSNAAKHLKANYLWVDRFAEIVLWFDDDEAGKIAVEECAKLFKVGKVRVAKCPGYKDASDILQAGQDGLIRTAIYAAQAWRPKGIVNANANVKDVLAPEDEVLSYSYPPSMPKLNEMTGGIVLGEVIYHVAGTGVGKSTALREIQHHLVEQGVKIAVLSFEDTIRDMKMGLMSVAASERLHLRPVPPKEDQKGRISYNEWMAKWHTATFGSGLVELFDPETAEWTMDAILGYVRYCAKALDCKVIFIDPISFVAAGIELTADERRVLDKVAGEFAKLAKELNINLQISHHLKRTQGIPHEEGAPTSLNELRSSGGLANFAMCVVGWERNNQAEGESWRVTQSRILKPARRVGRSGLADVLLYGENGRLVPSQLAFPPIGKPDGKDGGEHQTANRSFGPVEY